MVGAIEQVGNVGLSQTFLALLGTRAPVFRRPLRTLDPGTSKLAFLLQVHKHSVPEPRIVSSNDGASLPRVPALVGQSSVNVKKEEQATRLLTHQVMLVASPSIQRAAGSVPHRRQELMSVRLLMLHLETTTMGSLSGAVNVPNCFVLHWEV